MSGTTDVAADRREPRFRFSINCPHCGTYARVRTSRAQTATVRTAQLECQNFDCRHVFGAQLAITHTISPSLIPNADVTLPIAPPRAPAHNDNCGAGGPHAPPAFAACPSSAAAAS